MWHSEEVAGSFGEALERSPHGPRVIALHLRRGYRDAAATRSLVTLSRYAPCRRCEQRGCEACSFAGWRIEGTVLDVSVPAGATAGTRVVPDGVSDGSVVVELVEPGTRLEELRAAEKDHEAKLSSAWQMDRSTRHRGRRQMQLVAAGAATLVALAAVGHWLAEAGAGERCAVDDECRSGHCMRLLIVTPDPAAPRLDGRQCTASCATDLDCPSSMHCATRAAAEDVTARKVQYVAELPPGRSCVPQGY